MQVIMANGLERGEVRSGEKEKMSIDRYMVGNQPLNKWNKTWKEEKTKMAELRILKHRKAKAR